MSRERELELSRGRERDGRVEQKERDGQARKKVCEYIWKKATKLKISTNVCEKRFSSRN